VVQEKIGQFLKFSVFATVCRVRLDPEPNWGIKQHPAGLSNTDPTGANNVVGVVNVVGFSSFQI
jgi:hypothetical protein